MQSLLYSDKVAESDFESRSVKCLVHHFNELTEDTIEGKTEQCQQVVGISRRLFESWQKKQGEIISNKLREFFTQSDLKLKGQVRQVFDQWKHAVEILKLQDYTNQLTNELEKIRAELMFEKEECLQYQKKLQARHTKEKSSKQIIDPEVNTFTFQTQEKKNSNEISQQLGMLSPIKSQEFQNQLSPKELQDSIILGAIDRSDISHTEYDTNDRYSSMFKRQDAKSPSSKYGVSRLDFKHRNDSNLSPYQKSDERLRRILERFMQDKNRTKTGYLSTAQQRELEHMVEFVKKIQGESSECTFHPQLNPKSIQLLENKPKHQMSAKQLFERLHQEGYIKQSNMAKWLEMKEEKDMQQCTFSPKTNSPLSQDPKRKLSPDEACKRLHYQDLELRQEKLSKKEAEKIQKFKDEYTFKPERSQTKKMDSLILKGDKENENKYERLYRGYMEKAEKLESKRKEQYDQERAMINSLGRKKSRSKSSKKLTSEYMTITSQLSSFFPQSTTNQRNNTVFVANQKAMLSNQTTTKRNKENTMQLSARAQTTLGNITNLSSPSAFNRLYQNAELSKKKKEQMRTTIDQELGMSFSPKLFKPSSRVASPKQNVIERNEQFERNKLQKRLEREEQKYSDCTFEPTFITKKSRANESVSTASGVGDRLYQNALKQEEKKSRKRLELEQQLKQKYLKKRNNQVL